MHHFSGGATPVFTRGRAASKVPIAERAGILDKFLRYACRGEVAYTIQIRIQILYYQVSSVVLLSSTCNVANAGKLEWWYTCCFKKIRPRYSRLSFLFSLGSIPGI